MSYLLLLIKYKPIILIVIKHLDCNISRIFHKVFYRLIWTYLLINLQWNIHFHISPPESFEDFTIWVKTEKSVHRRTYFIIMTYSPSYVVFNIIFTYIFVICLVPRGNVRYLAFMSTKSKISVCISMSEVRWVSKLILKSLFYVFLCEFWISD